MDFFENYAIVAMESENVTFYACKIIKVTSGFNVKKTIFFARWHQHPKTAELTPPGPPGVSREAKSSTEFKFGSLVP